MNFGDFFITVIGSCMLLLAIGATIGILSIGTLFIKKELKRLYETK